MRKMINALFIFLVPVILLTAISCSEVEKTDQDSEKISDAAPEGPPFDPDKPAPVPEGTPPY